MNTRFSSLVTIKKSTLDKSQRAVQNASRDLDSATKALELSYSELDNIKQPQSGIISQLLASNTLINSQRSMIKHNQEWVDYAKNQLLNAKEQLKKDMIEYEKFKYLELEEMRKIIKEQKIKEMKDLDEVALMTFTRRDI